ncbi:RDD family protein [Halorubrum aquaticum]|uniref:RDD family protein n=1 Tax=Halorubrum aquaticum TaxID=387340 RepID=A0A1I3ACC2_9EURY|nr:RDD family protein [Halorubrum aquaticum]SFH47734.1 RDD family protein [Halorubrum aquaticum]
MERPRFGTDTNAGLLLRRGGALVVDALLVATLLGLAAVAFSLLIGTSLLAGRFVLPVAYLGYYVAFEGTFGRTPGKALLGLVVLERDGSSCGIRAAFIRNLLRVVDGAVFYLVGAVVVLLTDGDRRVGDHLAGTRVVRSGE